MVLFGAAGGGCGKGPESAASSAFAGSTASAVTCDSDARLPDSFNASEMGRLGRSLILSGRGSCVEALHNKDSTHKQPLPLNEALRNQRQRRDIADGALGRQIAFARGNWPRRTAPLCANCTWMLRNTGMTLCPGLTDAGSCDLRLYCGFN